MDAHRDETPDDFERFDAVVIGSGFGGSVVAFRLASAGRRVCVLERGRKYPPGSFARTPREMRRNLWRPSRQHYGIFDVWSFRHIEAIVSAGVGGGSLIYANVLIRKDENWFFSDGIKGGKQPWPISREDLEPHYARVEEVLAPQIFPDEYMQGSKAEAMLQAARRMKIGDTTHTTGDPTAAQWFRPKLAVTFANPGCGPMPGVPIVNGEPNIHNRPRETCRLCGECDIGCNYGAKNTLDYTYLSRAVKANRDTRICELTEVEELSYHPDRRDAYEISYVVHDPEAPGQVERKHLTAERLIVACGSLGSTLLLMRNRKNLPKLSKTLGTRFSGNGDYLAFARGCKTKTNGRSKTCDLRASRAPVITSTFRFPDRHDTERGHARGRYVQDAGYPALADYIWEVLGPFAVIRRALKFVWARLRGWMLRTHHTEIAGQIERLIGSGARSASSMPLLGMGRDTPDGVLRLDRHRRLQLTWTSTRSQPYYAQVDKSAAAIAKALGGRYSQNPLTSIFNRSITVHPLGGSPMGRDANEGVVDNTGEVFGYRGLYVADGSVLPGPVGANPSLTIAAFADRCADRILQSW